MNWLDRIRARRTVDADLAEEIAQHLEERIETLVREGRTPEAARRQARREFGSVAFIAERGRDVWRFTLIENAWADLRYGCRQLARTPGFTAAVVLTLAVGIGAVTAVYSLIDATFFRPLPFAEPGRLVRVLLPVPLDLTGATAVRASGSSASPVARPRSADITDLWTMPEVFSGAAAYATGGVNLGAGAEPLRIQATYVIYSLLAYSVAQRTREIGLRIALGAAPSQVVAMTVRQGLALAVMGIAIGLGSAVAVTRFAESMLYGIGPRDPMVLAAAALGLFATALVAALIPARRAARVDPMTALRTE